MLSESTRSHPATYSPASARMGCVREAQGHMNGANILDTIDRVCGQFAAALQHSELKIYTTIALVIVLSALLFPPKDDPDQV